MPGLNCLALSWGQSESAEHREKGWGIIMAKHSQKVLDRLIQQSGAAGEMPGTCSRHCDTADCGNRKERWESRVEHFMQKQ